MKWCQLTVRQLTWGLITTNAKRENLGKLWLKVPLGLKIINSSLHLPLGLHGHLYFLDCFPATPRSHVYKGEQRHWCWKMISRSRVVGPEQVPHWQDNWVGQGNWSSNWKSLNRCYVSPVRTQKLWPSWWRTCLWPTMASSCCWRVRRVMTPTETAVKTLSRRPSASLDLKPWYLPRREGIMEPSWPCRPNSATMSY